MNEYYDYSPDECDILASLSDTEYEEWRTSGLSPSRWRESTTARNAWKASGLPLDEWNKARRVYELEECLLTGGTLIESSGPLGGKKTYNIRAIAEHLESRESIFGPVKMK